MKNTCRILIFFVAVCLFLIAADIPEVLAQAEREPTGFTNVHLWVYPEYDDPRLLVMLEGQIAGVEPPASVRFLVPSAAEMYSAGSMDAQGQYSGGPPQRAPSSIPGWDEISYEVTTDTFRVEYYDPIIMGRPDKTISYEFRWLYPISDLTVIIQEPRRSSDFSVLPGGETFTDDQGFASHLYKYRDLDNQPPLSFEISYTKSDPDPSLSIEGNGSTSPLLVVIIAVGLCVVFVAGFLWIMKSKPKTRAQRRYAARDAPAPEYKGRRPARRFCSQCGQRVEGPSRFCPHCGAKLQ